MQFAAVGMMKGQKRSLTPQASCRVVGGNTSPCGVLPPELPALSSYSHRDAEALTSQTVWRSILGICSCC